MGIIFLAIGVMAFLLLARIDNGGLPPQRGGRGEKPKGPKPIVRR